MNERTNKWINEFMNARKIVNSEWCIFIAPYSPKGGIGLVTINVLISITNNNLTIETKPKKKWQQNYNAYDYDNN